MKTSFAVDSRVSRVCAIVIAIVAVAFSPTGLGQEGEGLAPPPGGYQILAGDVLAISVWGETALDRSVLVRPDGGISFPLAGDMQAAGRTVPELQNEIAMRLSRYIPDAVVTVTVQEVQGHQVYVLGQVQNPGAYIMNPRLDVLQVLAVAGGTTPFASLNDIRIIRRMGAEQVVLAFRYDDVARGRNLQQNILLQYGDTVVVP